MGALSKSAFAAPTCPESQRSTSFAAAKCCSWLAATAFLTAFFVAPSTAANSATVAMCAAAIFVAIELVELSSSA